jgi:predicted unusual protein kinase regulating ubiquinone biosynthesis (AarF/ABC1/UbiB family)
MKVAQLLATIPDALPPEYANELMKLQSQAPPMGWAFVKRRMSAELGPDWQKKFSEFGHHPAAAASLGQVHRARTPGGDEVACKLQYPDMQSAVEADLNQLQLLFAIRKRFDPVIDTSEIAVEIGARLREELDYGREAKHVALYQHMLKMKNRSACRKSGPICQRAACSHWTGFPDASCSSTRRIRSPCAIAWRRPCSPPGGFPSAVSA